MNCPPANSPATAFPRSVWAVDDLDDAIAAATELWQGAVARGYRREAMQPYRGTIGVGDVAVEGTVLGDPERAHLAKVTASRVKAKHRLRAFTELVFSQRVWSPTLRGNRSSWGATRGVAATWR